MGHRTWMYHDTEKAKVVDSDECEALEKEGWRHSFRKGGAGEEPMSPIDFLRTTAADFGIKVDNRWGVDRLESEIKAAEEKAEA